MILDPSTNEIDAATEALKAKRFVSWRDTAKLALEAAAKTRRLPSGTLADATLALCDALTDFRKHVPEECLEKINELAKARIDLAMVGVRRALTSEQAKQEEAIDRYRKVASNSMVPVIMEAIIGELRDQSFDRPEALDCDFGDPKWSRIEGHVNVKALAVAVTAVVDHHRGTQIESPAQTTDDHQSITDAEILVAIRTGTHALLPVEPTQNIVTALVLAYKSGHEDQWISPARIFELGLGGHAEGEWMAHAWVAAVTCARYPEPTEFDRTRASVETYELALKNYTEATTKGLSR